MASYNDLFAKPYSAHWDVERKGKPIAQVELLNGKYGVVLQGTPLSCKFDTMAEALRAIDRRV